MGVKTHLSVNLPQSVSISGAEINLTLRAVYHSCPMLQFGSKHVGIEDVHIFKHCHEMTGLLLWIGTYCISSVVQQTNIAKDLSSLVRHDDSCLAAIRHVQRIIRVVRPRPNIRSHSVLLIRKLNRREKNFS